MCIKLTIVRRFMSNTALSLLERMNSSDVLSSSDTAYRQVISLNFSVFQSLPLSHSKE